MISVYYIIKTFLYYRGGKFLRKEEIILHLLIEKKKYYLIYKQINQIIFYVQIERQIKLKIYKLKM